MMPRARNIGFAARPSMQDAFDARATSPARFRRGRASMMTYVSAGRATSAKGLKVRRRLSRERYYAPTISYLK